MHIGYILNGVITFPPDDPVESETLPNAVASFNAANPGNITKTLYVSLTPNKMADFIDVIQKWCKHNK